MKKFTVGGLTTAWATVLKSWSVRKVEKHRFRWLYQKPAAVHSRCSYTECKEDLDLSSGSHGVLIPQTRHPALGPNTPRIGDKRMEKALNIALIILLPKFPKTEQVSPHLFLPFAHNTKRKRMYHARSPSISSAILNHPWSIKFCTTAQVLMLNTSDLYYLGSW